MTRFSNSQQREPSRILIIDPDPAVRRLLSDTVEGAGFTAVSHGTPGAAHVLDAGLNYAISFVDVEHTGLRGVELVRILREQDLVGSMVVMDRENGRNSLEALKQCACDVLIKPFSQDALDTIINSYCEREQNRSLLLSHSGELRSLLQRMPVLVFELDKRLELRFVNHSSKELLGFTPNEALNTPHWFLTRVHPSDVPKVQRAFLEAFATRRPFSLECRMLHKKGSEHHGIIRSVPLTSAQAEAQYMQAVFLDISDRVYIEKAMVQNEKIKTLGTISAEVAHEVRNPLMSIAGFARRLSRKIPDAPESSIILREALRLEKLLNRIREFLRTLEAKGTECRVNKVLGESLKVLFLELERAEVWCMVDTDDSIPSSAVDMYALREVCIALVRAVVKGLHKGGVCGIRTYESNQTIHLEFRRIVGEEEKYDSEALFMPFDENGEDSDLPTCYRLVKSMGGILSLMTDYGYLTYAVSLPVYGSTSLIQPPEHEPDFREDADQCFDEETPALLMKCFMDLFERRVRSLALESKQFSLLLCRAEIVQKESSFGYLNNELMQRVIRVFDGCLRYPWRWVAKVDYETLAVFVPDSGSGEAHNVAERLRYAIRNLAVLSPAPAGGVELPSLDVKIGMVTCRPGAKTHAEEVLDLAKHALELANQEQGSGQHCITLRTDAPV